MSSNGSSDKAFGFVFAGFFLLIGLLPLIHQAPIRIWAMVLAMLFALLAMVRPKLLGPFNRLWTRFGLVLHRLMTPVIMSLLFFLTVTPIALLMRLFGKRPLELSFDPQAESYWVHRDTLERDSMKRQF